MCPKDTDAPAWKSQKQIADAWKTQIAYAISDADGNGRTEEGGTGVTRYALSTILRMAGGGAGGGGGAGA